MIDFSKLVLSVCILYKYYILHGQCIPRDVSGVPWINRLYCLLLFLMVK